MNRKKDFNRAVAGEQRQAWKWSLSDKDLEPNLIKASAPPAIKIWSSLAMWAGVEIIKTCSSPDARGVNAGFMHIRQRQRPGWGEFCLIAGIA